MDLDTIKWISCQYILSSTHPSHDLTVKYCALLLCCRLSNSVVLLGSVIRMFLQRSRYLRAKGALKAWRIDHGMPVLQSLRGEVVRQKKIEAGLQGVRVFMAARTYEKITRARMRPKHRRFVERCT